MARSFHLDPEKILDLPIDRLLLYYAYLTEEPSEDRYNTALTCSTFVNCWSSKKVKPEDFLPRVAKRQMKDDEILNVFQALKKKR